MKNIILIPPTPFEKRHYERYGIEILKKYFNVFVIDLSYWIAPNTWKEFKNVYKIKNYVKINNKKELLKILSNIKSPIVIDRIVKNRKTDWVRSVLRNKRSVFVDLKLGGLPTPKYSNFDKLKNFLKRKENPIKLFLYLIHYFEENYYSRKVYKPSITIFGGLHSLKKSKEENKILSHSLDYENFLKLKEKKINQSKDYAVFVDVNVPSHPDYKFLYRDQPMDFLTYYQKLNIFLKKFSKSTKMPIHFSIHPRTDSDEIKKIKTIIDSAICSQGHTLELIKDCKCVLQHQSTTLSYAVLFKKPITILTNNELEKSWYKGRTDSTANYFSKPVLNMDHEIVNHKFLEVDDDIYNKYIDEYLRVPNSSEEPIWENFSKYILKNNFN